MEALPALTTFDSKRSKKTLVGVIDGNHDRWSWSREGQRDHPGGGRALSRTKSLEVVRSECSISIDRHAESDS